MPSTELLTPYYRARARGEIKLTRSSHRNCLNRLPPRAPPCLAPAAGAIITTTSPSAVAMFAPRRPQAGGRHPQSRDKTPIMSA